MTGSYGVDSAFSGPVQSMADEENPRAVGKGFCAHHVSATGRFRRQQQRAVLRRPRPYCEPTMPLAPAFVTSTGCGRSRHVLAMVRICVDRAAAGIGSDKDRLRRGGLTIDGAARGASSTLQRAGDLESVMSIAFHV